MREQRFFCFAFGLCEVPEAKARRTALFGSNLGRKIVSVAGPRPTARACTIAAHSPYRLAAGVARIPTRTSRWTFQRCEMATVLGPAWC